jgi:hypothetical protein
MQRTDTSSAPGDFTWLLASSCARIGGKQKSFHHRRGEKPREKGLRSGIKRNGAKSMLTKVLKESRERRQQHHKSTGLRLQTCFVDPVFVEQTRYLHPPSPKE